MPLGKGQLKVETNINGVIYEDETTRDVFYKRNSQREPRQPVGEGYAKPFGHPDIREQAEEFEMPPEMEKAINNDLADKGVATKPKRTRKKKTTTD